MLGSTNQFYPHLREGSKKTFSSWPFTIFRGTSLARGVTFIAWRGAAESNEADLASCTPIQGLR